MNASAPALAKQAFLFDMDGTIVDNMAFHTTSWLAFFERQGHVLDADAFFRDTAGRQGREIIAKYLGEDADHVTLLAEKEVVYANCMARTWPRCLASTG